MRRNPLKLDYVITDNVTVRTRVILAMTGEVGGPLPPASPSPYPVGWLEYAPMARILVVDDDAIARSLLSAALANQGHEVEEARDGREGSALAKTIPFDLVITDIFMPEKDGIELIQELRAHDPALKIIAISGGYQFKGMNVLKVAQHLGATRGFLKSDGVEELVMMAQEVLVHAG